jgi:hypothetical protein
MVKGENRRELIWCARFKGGAFLGTYFGAVVVEVMAAEQVIVGWM